MSILTRLRRVYNGNRLGVFLLTVLIVLVVVHSQMGGMQPGFAVVDDSIEDVPPVLDKVPTTHPPYKLPYSLDLRLPQAFLDHPFLKDEKKCLQQYGFNLDVRCDSPAFSSPMQQSSCS